MQKFVSDQNISPWHLLLPDVNYELLVFSVGGRGSGHRRPRRRLGDGHGTIPVGVGHYLPESHSKLVNHGA